MKKNTAVINFEALEEDAENIKQFLKLIASVDAKRLAKASKKVVAKPSLINTALKYL